MKYREPPAKLPLDVDVIIEGGALDRAGRPPIPLTVTLPPRSSLPSRQPKNLRLRTDLIEQLKDMAYLQTKATGARVTETDLIEAALDAYFKKESKKESKKD
jgi:hypothetical protein